MLISVLSVFVLALAVPWLVRARPVAAGCFFALLPASLAVYYADRLGDVAEGEAIVETTAWVPELGVHLTFYADGLSLLFALLIVGVGALVSVYSGGYLRDDPRIGDFFRLFFFFMASMLGLVLAGNLLTLFVFWELTSISSFFLIGFHHQEKETRQAAQQALLVTAVGEQVLLAGIILLGQAGGSFAFAELLQRGEAIRQSGLYLPILLLVLAGAFAKSAQMPLHFWLPAAMTAPTPVSAYLHSVTMVKAGVYLLARLTPVLGGSGPWQLLLVGIGGTTMLLGAVFALWQSDLKRLLAYSTINALGTLVFLLGIYTDIAVKAALVFLLVHALYKGALFLVAGIIDHETGTRDLRQLHGLFRKMPLVAVAAALAAFSLAGIPPLFGFIGKETIYHAVLHAPVANFSLTALAVAANVALVALAGVIVFKPFFSGSGTGKAFHLTPPALSQGPILLAAGGLLIGLFPQVIDHRLLTPATLAIVGSRTEVELELWHGINPRLVLSLVTVALGGALYFWRHPIQSFFQPLRRLGAWGPERWYDWALAGLDRVARGQTRLLQNGNLQNYLLVVVLATFGLIGTSLAINGGFSLPPGRPVAVHDAAVTLLILAAAALAVRAPSRLEAIVAMGGVGFGIALLYARFSAPDLAMTQFAVETVTVILFVLVLHRLPEYPGPSGGAARGRDALVAAGVGVLIAVLVAATLGSGGESRLAPFFAANTQLAAHGRNMVNVILVDFRSLDTVGEISVLALAALGVHALLKAQAGERAAVNSVIVATTMRYFVPLLLLFAGFLLLRGHSQPGGGFIAGLLFAAAYAFYGFAAGARQVRSGLPLSPLLLIGGGLLVVLASGLPALARGRPFLTGIWGDFAVTAPLKIALGTPVLFDVGIALAVTGAALTIILILWEAE